MERWIDIFIALAADLMCYVHKCIEITSFKKPTAQSSLHKMSRYTFLIISINHHLHFHLHTKSI